MRIEKLNLNKAITQTQGIEEINLTRLGSVIALIGKNGSGKSRILKLIEQSAIPKINVIDLVEENVSSPPVDFVKYNEKLKEYYYLQAKQSQLQNLVNQDRGSVSLNTKLGDLTNKVVKLGQTPEIRDQVAILNKSQGGLPQVIQRTIPKYFKKINYSEISALQQTIDQANLDTSTFESLIEKVTEEENYHELTSISKTALSYLSKLPHRLVKDKDDSYGNQKEYENKMSHKRFISLKNLVKIFLNKDLTWEKLEVNSSITESGVTTQAKGVWKLSGRPFNYSEFSDGEKTLFAYSLLFFLLEQNPKIRIRESIIVIDEPELHLHPESEIAVIRGIRKIIEEKGQLWIATHSINILADLSYDEIFMVKDNAIVPPGRAVPGRTFIELMGLDQQIEKLTNFIVNISNWAFLNFMTQCFNEPDVIKSARPNDPEVELFKKSIKTKNEGSVLLDFGAGKGRIYKEINFSDEFHKTLHYYALEANPVNAAELQKTGIKELYTDYILLPDNTFDFILLCGVLHEIPAIEWLQTLNKIKSSLKEDGYIILIEDIRLPIGEKIGEDGFLILDIDSSKLLFSMKENPSQIISSDGKYKDRIICSLFGKAQINDVTIASITNAVISIKSNAYEKIRNIRKEIPTTENKLSLGRESAFYSQLYINSDLTLEKLSSFQKQKASFAEN